MVASRARGFGQHARDRAQQRLACRGAAARGRSPPRDLISTSRPRYITTTSSAISAITPMSCVIRMIARPRSPAAAQQVQDLRLRGHVERRGRLVGDQDARIAGERHGDHHPLAQAAGELERILVDPPRRLRHADQSPAARSRAPGPPCFDSGECSRIASMIWLPTVWNGRTKPSAPGTPAPISPPRMCAHRGAVRARPDQVDHVAVRPAQQNLAAHDAARAARRCRRMRPRGDALAAAALADDAERAAREQRRSRAPSTARTMPSSRVEMGLQAAHREDRLSHRDPPRRAARRRGN